MKVQNPPGSTPLDEEALRGLIPNLTTQGELNEFEAENISEAILWARNSRTLKKDLISVTGLLKIHQKMFDQTCLTEKLIYRLCVSQIKQPVIKIFSSLQKVNPMKPSVGGLRSNLST